MNEDKYPVGARVMVLAAPGDDPDEFPRPGTVTGYAGWAEVVFDEPIKAWGDGDVGFGRSKDLPYLADDDELELIHE